MNSYTIDFEPVGKRGKCSPDKTILDCARHSGVGIISLCGGTGRFCCCKVQILTGSVKEPTPSELECFSSEELKDGYRLACQTYLTSDCKVRIPFESLTTPQRIQLEAIDVSVEPEPSVSTYHIQLSSPSFSDLRADGQRIIETLNSRYKLYCNSVDIDVLRNISSQLRAWNWKAQVSLRSNEVIAINSPTSRQLGIAIDLGTTKIAGYLLDLNSGKTLAAEGIMNPQISYGEDIIARITYAMKSPAKAKELQDAAVRALNQLTANLSRQVGAKLEEIIEAVIVGNTAMHHLLLCLPVEQLACSPFVPAVRRALDIKARDMGLRIAPGAYVHLPPNIAGFVGADHLAMLLATQGIWKDNGLIIAMDIGTNTEISLIDNGQISSVSCASGPAFEGAHIKFGCRAANGAIERLQLVNDEVRVEVIGGVSPVGLCGSGILDAIAQLYLASVISRDGKMNNHPRVRTSEGQPEFVLVSEEQRGGPGGITITQKDIREIQLAKAAIRTGIKVLLQQKGYPEENINKVIIAGAFGSYINVESAVNIGMLPPLDLDIFQQVGNAAGIGAKLTLASINKRAGAQDIAHRACYIELAKAPDFEQIFLQETFLG